MILVTAATHFEMQAFAEAGGDRDHTRQLVTGVALVETTLALTSLLQAEVGSFDAVVNFGVAGAYPENGADPAAELLDICLAEQEVLGDLGICVRDGFERFRSPPLVVCGEFVMDHALVRAADLALEHEGTRAKRGIFVTVNCASGTRKRGRQLAGEFQGLCENMEGAAVARVCQQFGVPMLEVRCISNLVEDRNPGHWKLQQAVDRAGQAAATIIRYLLIREK
ncbi:MAG: futalosine hydrolase [Desulfocapsa sp.]|nr:MAG: futalosine hydrolase [Desulfocapsa sp.]